MIPGDHQDPPALIGDDSIILHIAIYGPWIEQVPLRGPKYFPFS